MTNSQGGSIEAFVTHARHVPSGHRSAFAAAGREAVAGRAVILETCHRVEVYVGGPDLAPRLRSALPPGGRAMLGERAVRHAMRVAVGRDSVVLGEDQVLHQLRVSVDEARAAGTLDPTLERLFTLALRAGRLARSWHRGPARSLADVALESIERQAGPLRGRPVLIVGAGAMGRLAARAAVAAGASVAIANRSVDSATTLAAACGARTESFDPGPRIGAVAGVIVALSGPWLIGPRTIDALAEGAMVVVDLSVPVAVPDALMAQLGDRFITADALALREADRTSLPGPATRLDALADRTAAEFLDWQRGREGRTVAAALVERANLERATELDALWRRLPDLEPDARREIEAMTRHFTERLLREPLERLGRDSDGRDGRAIRDIFAL
jgi:glutamyl-tRNA reductase